jgi:hypothetical protein
MGYIIMETATDIIVVTVEGPKVTAKWKAFLKDNCSTVWRVLDSFSYNSLKGRIRF